MVQFVFYNDAQCYDLGYNGLRNSAKHKVLICDRDPSVRALTRKTLDDKGFKFDYEECAHKRQCYQYLENNRVLACLIEHDSNLDKTNFSYIKTIKRLCPACELVIMGDLKQDDSKTHLHTYAIRAGAIDFIRKGCEMYTRMPAAIKEIQDKTQLVHHAEGLKDAFESRRQPFFIPQKGPYKELFAEAIEHAKQGINLLIRGETGTGKSAIVEYIHQNINPEIPLITYNCGSDNAMIESELFGHVKGAFTGADEDRTGKLALADGGILFLEEIANMPKSIQQKLLVAIEKRPFEPLGSNKSVYSDFLLISATNEDLNQLIQENKFRKDFYYRVAEYTIELPPLRNCPEAIPEFVDYYLKKYDPKFHKDHPLTQEQIDFLQNHDWPGNLRELASDINIIVKTGRFNYKRYIRNDANGDANESTLQEKKESLEKSEVIRQLRITSGNKTKAAKQLGIDRKSIIRKIEKWGLDVSVYKNKGNKKK